MDSLGKLVSIKVLEFAARQKPFNAHHVQASLSPSELSTDQVFAKLLKALLAFGGCAAALRVSLCVCVCVGVFAEQNLEV